MADIFSSLHAAGFSPVRETKAGNNWTLLNVTSSTGLQTSKTDVLFFNSNSTWTTIKEAEQALRALRPNRDYHPVVQNSAKGLPQDLDRVSRELGTRNRALTVRTLLLNALLRNGSVEGIDVFEEPRFVEPTLRTARGEGDALNMLVSWLRDLDTLSGPHLGVVLAGAGVGKTTMMREVYAKLLKRRGSVSVPLLVESNHWAKFAATSSDLDLADIWKNSFDSLYSAIISDELLEESVHRGAITILFDGFDELCTKMGAQFRPSATLERVRDLLLDNEGKILITSRQAFWNDFVEPSLKSEFLNFELLPFSKQQTEAYWGKAFPGSGELSKRERARTIHSRIETQASSPFREQLGAVPAVVAMIAECADEDTPAGKYGKYLDEDRPLDGLIKYVCSREQTRRLPSVEPEAQVRWLTDLAIDFGTHFPASELKEYAEIDLGLGRPELDAIVAHALLQTAAGHKTQAFTFRFDFLAEYLPARWAATELRRDSQGITGRLMKLMARNASGGSEFIDYVAQELTAANETGALTELFNGLPQEEGHIESEAAKSCLFHISLNCIERLLPSGPRSDRTAELLRLLGFPKGQISSLAIWGNISGLDFSGVTFRECVFRDIALSKCLFDSGTKFSGCKFEGRFEIDDLGNFGAVQIGEDCQLSPAALETVQRALGGRKIPITETQILDNFHTALNKFKRGLCFKSLDADNMRRGSIGRSTLCDEIWEALEKSKVISFHSISGLGPRSGVAIEKGSIPEVQRFLDNRLVVGKIASAVDQVKKRVSRTKEKAV
jgi:NACHT domain